MDNSRATIVAALLFTVGAMVACGNTSKPGGATGGTSSPGGAGGGASSLGGASGGTSSLGGASGGTPSLGGASGGTSSLGGASGGASSQGGRTQAGGTQAGGAAASGGAAGTGGQSGMGGASARLDAAADGDAGASACDRTDLVWKTASKTEYTSFPDPGSPECIQYSGCDYMGMFAACSAHDIVAAFPDFATLKLHDLCLKSGKKTIVVTVIDTCGDSDCGGCCTQNKGSADELIDIESYTAARFGVPDGRIQWADLGPTQGQACP